jgi:hypothetical protein
MLDILIIVAWAATTVLFVAVAAAAAAGDVTIAVDPLEAQRRREQAVGHAELVGGCPPWETTSLDTGVDQLGPVALAYE